MLRQRQLELADAKLEEEGLEDMVGGRAHCRRFSAVPLGDDEQESTAETVTRSPTQRCL